MRNAILRLAVASTILIPGLAAADGNINQPYNAQVPGNALLHNRNDDGLVTVYGDFNHLSHRYYSDPFIFSPYRSQTHALHPYYRNSYWTRTGRRQEQSNPLFIQYLKDLYYEGQLGGAYATRSFDLPREVTPQQTCYNYTAKRRTYRTPPYYTGCN